MIQIISNDPCVPGAMPTETSNPPNLFIHLRHPDIRTLSEESFKIEQLHSP